MAGGSTTAVYTAIGANSIVAVAKFTAFAMTGSGAMLSEGIHSVADVSNQCLLALGLARSKRPATEEHPYGFGREQFVWALISAVGIFFLGCGVTLYHGVHSLMEGAEMHSTGIALGVLAFSFVIEGACLMIAIHALRKEAKRKNMTLLPYIRGGGDPMGAAVLLEDGAAVLGVVIAAACIGLGEYTGYHGWDGIGSILIGLLLGWVAIWLINQNRTSLVGRAVPAEQRSRVIEVLSNDPVVENITDVKATMVDGTGFRFKAEIDFDGRLIARQWIAERDLPSLVKKAETEKGLYTLLEEFGEDVLSSLGNEINRLENEIREKEPAAKHVDIETD